MPNFGFQRREDDSYANKYFWARCPVVCIAFLGCLGPLFLLGMAGEHELLDTPTWFDVPPSMENPAVCEKAVPLGGCGDWTESSDETKCYKFYPKMKKQESAYEACTYDGAVFAMPKTAGQNADIYQLCGANSPCWIGLKRPTGVLDGWQWFDGTSLSYANWYEGEPNNMSDGEEGEEETAAVIGFTRWGEAASGAIFAAAVMGFFGVLVNIVVVLTVCGLVFMALKSKNDGLIICAASCDAYCGFCMCLSLGQAVMRLAAGGDAFAPGAAIGALVEMVLLCMLAVCGFQLRNKILDEKRARMQQGQGQVGAVVGQVTVGQVVGQPVQPATVVTGQIVSNNPV